MTRRPPAAAAARYEYLSRAAQRSGTPRARRALRPQADVSETTPPTRPFPVQVRNPCLINHRSAHLRCAPIRLPTCSPGTPTTTPFALPAATAAKCWPAPPNPGTSSPTMTDTPSAPQTSSSKLSPPTVISSDHPTSTATAPSLCHGANRDGWDTIAFNGHDKFDIVANGKPKAVKLLQELIAYERRPSRD